MAAPNDIIEISDEEEETPVRPAEGEQTERARRDLFGRGEQKDTPPQAEGEGRDIPWHPGVVRIALIQRELSQLKASVIRDSARTIAKVDALSRRVDDIIGEF